MPYKPTHANGTFTKFGAPEIEKLYNDRYRIVVRCNVKGVDSKWHYSNVENFWKDFGSLYESPLQVDGADVGWEPATGETYPNMRLIEVAQNYPRTPNDGAPVLEFTYETLTSSYVQDADDKVDHELNGLRRVTRTVIATEDSSYAKVVGTDTIDHTGRGYGSETLTLASAEEVPKRENEGGFTRIQETWSEAGLIDTLVQNLDAGVKKVTQTFIVQEGATVGPVISKNTENVGGLPVITVTTLQDADGNAINSGGTNLIRSYESLVNFTYPGVVSIIKDTLGARDYTNYDDITSYDFYLTPPSESLVEATTYIFFQDSGSITAPDYTYDNADGLWNPQTWAQSYAHGIDKNDNPFATTKALRGYRAHADVDVVVVEPSSDFRGNYLVNGRPIQTRNEARIGIQGGPENPEGNKYVLDVQITPSYEDISGNLGYKKKIVVATIPERVGVLYSPSSSELITSDITDNIYMRRSGFLEPGTYSSSPNEIPLEWDQLVTSSNDLTNQAHVTISSSDPSYGVTYHRVTSYNPSTGVFTFTPSAPANNLFYLYYKIVMTTRTGKVAGNEDSTNKIRLSPPATAGARSNIFDDFYNGTQIKIRRLGMISAQTRTITDFDGFSRVATVNADFNPALGPTDTYEILQ